MKRYALLIMLVIALLFASCEKNEAVVPNRTILATIASSGWTMVNGGRGYTSTVNMPEIDNYFNEHGGVLVYVSFGNRTYEQVPQVYNGVSYSYVTRPGQLVLEVQASDGTSVITAPGAVSVKIVLVESL